MTVKVRPYRGQPGVFEVDVSVMLPNGEPFRQRVKSPVPSKSGARRWGEDRERHIVLNWQATLRLEQRKEVPTLTAFFPRFIEEYAVANRHKPSVLEHKRVIFKGHLEPRFGTKKLDEIDNACVQQLKAALSDRNPKTVNNVLSNLSVILKAAMEWGVIERLPATIKLLKAPISESEFYDHDQYSRLVAAAEKIDWRIHALVLLGGDAGMRRGEIIAVKQTDFSHERGKITVGESDWKGYVTAPKSNRSRRVGLTARLAKVVKANRHLRSDRLLTKDDGKPLDARTVRDWVSQAQRLAGLKVTGKVHILRHTFCSHLSMGGATLMQIKELAGHASVTTTQRYMHLAPGNADEAIGLLEKARSNAGSEGAARANSGEILEKEKARS